MIKSSSLLLSGAWFLSNMVHAQQPTLSQQLLDSYFKTAGVCTTSQVESIEDAGDLVNIRISIEPSVTDTLLAAGSSERDNWFSLHCPPEIHGIWHQQNPPEDVQVTGQIEAGRQHILSCVQYQQNRYSQPDQRPPGMTGRITQWLKDRLP